MALTMAVVERRETQQAQQFTRMKPPAETGVEPVGAAPSHGPRARVESAQAWTRLAVTLLLSTIGGVGMWSVVVALPAVQAEFGVARAEASLPYTLTMVGFGFASIAMGRLADRFGIMFPVVVGTLSLALGY